MTTVGKRSKSKKTTLLLAHPGEALSLPDDDLGKFLLARTIHEFGKKEGLRCVRKTLLQALSHTQEAFTCETIPHDSL